MRRWPLTSLLCMGACSFVVAQMSIGPAAKAMANLPKVPPIFSQMTVILEGGLQYEDRVDFKGRVTSVDRSDEPQPIQRPNPVPTKTTLKFDESGRLTERLTKLSTGVSTETLVWENGKLQKQEVLHHRDDGKFADWTDWNQWSYGKGGRLSEFRSGTDKLVATDMVNFKYDAQGRLRGYELLAQEVVEVTYQSNEITWSGFQKYQHRKTWEHVQLVDDKGRVTDLKVSDINNGELKLWYHVAFKYDSKGRVIEQQTDPFKLGSGDDYSPLPGKLTVEYNDEKQSGEQKFYDSDGKFVLHTKFEYDRDGVPTKLQVIDESGKERIGGETFVDPQYKSTTRPGSVEWEVIYDDYGNWTERRRWFTPADGGSRIVTRLIRQNITYR